MPAVHRFPDRRGTPDLRTHRTFAHTTPIAPCRHPTALQLCPRPSPVRCQYRRICKKRTGGAYVHPWAVRIFERGSLVNLILLGDYARLCDAALVDIGHEDG